MDRISRKYLAVWCGIVCLVFSLLAMKLLLSSGRFLLQSNKSAAPIFAAEVHAADRDAKSQPAASTAQPAEPQKNAAVPSSAQTESVSVPEMMNHLQQKEAELKRKEEVLKQREEYLSKMKEEVEAKMKELVDVQKEIQAYRTEKQEGQNNQIRSLAKIYGSMKPKEAAKLLENLDEQLVVNIISTMNAVEAANILANMDVKKAAKISESLSHRQ